MLLVYDKLEFKKEKVVLPQGSRRSTASENTGPAQKLSEGSNPRWKTPLAFPHCQVTWKHSPPPGQHPNASALPVRILQAQFHAISAGQFPGQHPCAFIFPLRASAMLCVDVCYADSCFCPLSCWWTHLPQI